MPKGAVESIGDFVNATGESASIVSWKFSSTGGNCYWGVGSLYDGQSRPLVLRKLVDCHRFHCCGSVVFSKSHRVPNRLILSWDNLHSIVSTKEVLCRIGVGAHAAEWMQSAGARVEPPVLVNHNLDTGGGSGPHVLLESTIAAAVRSALLSTAYVSAACADPLASLARLPLAPGVQLGSVTKVALSSVSRTRHMVAEAASLLLQGLQRAPQAASAAAQGLKHLGELASTEEAAAATSAVLKCGFSAAALAGTPESLRVAADATRLLASLSRWLLMPQIAGLAEAGREMASAAVAVARRPEAARAATVLVRAAAGIMAQAADAAAEMLDTNTVTNQVGSSSSPPTASAPSWNSSGASRARQGSSGTAATADAVLESLEDVLLNLVSATSSAMIPREMGRSSQSDEMQEWGDAAATSGVRTSSVSTPRAQTSTSKSGESPAQRHVMAVSPLPAPVDGGSATSASTRYGFSVGHGGRTLGRVLAMDGGELPDARTLRPKAASNLFTDVSFVPDD